MKAMRLPPNSQDRRRIQSAYWAVGCLLVIAVFGFASGSMHGAFDGDLGAVRPCSYYQFGKIEVTARASFGDETPCVHPNASRSSRKWRFLLESHPLSQAAITCQLLSNSMVNRVRSGACLESAGSLNQCLSGMPAFDWSKAEKIAPGILYAQLSISQPRLMAINALRVDLAQPGINLMPTGRHQLWGKSMPGYPKYTIRTPRQRTSEFLNQCRTEGINMVAAINGGPWKPWLELGMLERKVYPYADRNGLAVSRGEWVTPSHAIGFGTFFIERNGNVDIVEATPELEKKDLLTAISGNRIVLRSGSVEGSNDLAPRTGIGLSQDKRYLFMVTIDGRQPGYSEGAGTRELGQLLKKIGSWTGMNLDGGGSTTMAIYRSKTGSVEVVNRPSDFGGRAVGNNFGVYLLSPKNSFLFEESLANFTLEEVSTMASSVCWNCVEKLPARSF